jgi:hypothetical protein
MYLISTIAKIEIHKPLWLEAQTNRQKLKVRDWIKVQYKKEEHTNNKTYHLHLALTLDSGHYRHIAQ